MTHRLQLPLIAVIVLFVIGHGAAQSKTGIAGKVITKVEQSPLGNVFILAHSSLSNTDVHVRSNAKGAYSIELPPGVYDLFFATEAYSPICRKIEVQPNETVNFNVTLDVNTLGMEISGHQ